MSPYRSPPLRLPPRVESMRVRRYPLVAQLLIAGWFPFVALATAEIYPDTTFACERTVPVGAIQCVLDESTPLHRRLTPVEATPNAVRTYEYGPDMLGIGHERFDEEIVDARRIKADYEDYLHHHGAPAFYVPLRSVSWLFWLCLACEVFLIAFYFSAQVRTRIEADLDEGTVAFERTRRLRRDSLRRIVLADVDSFRVDDLTDDARGHAVVAHMRTGEDEVLLTTVSGGAAETLRFLKSAKERAAA